MIRIYVSDCEGPISKNDNAFELTAHFVPDGDKLFTVISRYDDVLADTVKKPGHKAGSTLKLVLPFLKAYDVTDEKMREFSAKNLRLIPEAKTTLKHLRSLAPAFIVSTSYEHYIQALCQTVDFPFENTYCTKVNIDKYQSKSPEKTRLKQFAEEIVNMPVIEVPYKAKTLKDLPERDQKVIQRLDEIFWKEISCTDCGRMLTEVDPVGGSEKAVAIEDAARRSGAKVSDAMYVGDSITDEQAIQLVKSKGGLAVSFNGNQYAIRNAEIAILSEHSIATAVVADVFLRFGKQQALDIVEDWNPEALRKSAVSQALIQRLFSLRSGVLPKVKIINPRNIEVLAKESTEFRKTVRGEAIGGLG